MGTTQSLPIQRKTNIELLRIVAMFMVVLLHCNTFGKNLQNTDSLTANWFGVYLLESLSIVAVNCYVLISGYFLVTSEFKWRKIFSICFQVLFYSILFYVTIGLMYGWGSKFTMIWSLLPILTRSYWFATTYVALYAISPFLNIAIKSMSKIQMQSCLVVLLAIFCLWPSMLPFASSIDATNGYGVIWFVTLYFVAAYLRIYQPYKNIRRSYCIGIYLAVVLLSMLSWTISQKITFPYTQVFQRYNGCGTFVASVALFLWFMLINIKNIRINKAIVAMSGLTFGVYLIHENFLVREHLYTDVLNIPSYINTPMQIPYIIGCALGIYAVASLIEYLRQKIFAILKVDAVMQKMEDWITEKIAKLQVYIR